MSPLKGVDASRDSERDGARNFSQDAASYAESCGLGGLMSEMLNGLVVSKPEKPVEFLIELLGKGKAPRYCVVGPPGFALEGVTEAMVNKYNMVGVSLAPLVEEARERIIDGQTVAEHCADGKALPDNIVVKLLSERLAKPDCMEKGWVIEGVPATKGQAQQLIAAGYVPDKVAYLSAQDDTIIKAVPKGEEQQANKKSLVDKLNLYRWDHEKAAPIFAHLSKTFESKVPSVGSAGMAEIFAFLEETSVDPGLKDAKRC